MVMLKLVTKVLVTELRLCVWRLFHEQDYISQYNVDIKITKPDAMITYKRMTVLRSSETSRQSFIYVYVGTNIAFIEY